MRRTRPAVSSLVISCCLFAFFSSVYAVIEGDPVVPPWAVTSAGSVTRVDQASSLAVIGDSSSPFFSRLSQLSDPNAGISGTHCACDAASVSGSDGAKTFRSIRCQTYSVDISRLDIDINYKCRCFGMEVDCGYLSTALTFEENGFDPHVCTDLGVTAAVSFQSTVPPCTDAFNKTCGRTLGVRTDTRIQYSNFTESVACRKDIARIDCVSGLCGVNPDPCVLNDTLPDWSLCTPIRGECKKFRVQQIIREAVNGSPSCPFVIERTRYTDCTPEECAVIRCAYNQTEVIGPCNRPCGPYGMRNVTMVNISLTQLDRCTANFNPIISQYEEACAGNPPCLEPDITSNTTGTPMTVSCFTRGNAGYRGSHPKWIVVDVGTHIQTNASLYEIAASFRVFHKGTGRRMPIRDSEIVVQNSTFVLPFDISDQDAEGATGDQYHVHFRGIRDLAVNISGSNGVRIPPFTCLTVDQVPPVLIELYYRQGSDTLLAAFSEQVLPCSAYDGQISAGNFDMNGITVSTGTFEYLYFTGQVDGYLGGNRHYTLVTTAMSTNATVAAQAGAFCDKRLIPNEDGPTFGVSHLLVSFWTSFTQEGFGDFSAKLFSHNSTYGYVDRVLLKLTAPMLKSYLLDDFKSFRVRFLTSTGNFLPFATGVSFVESTTHDYTDRIILSFPPVTTAAGTYGTSVYQNLIVAVVGQVTLGMFESDQTILVPEGWNRTLPSVLTAANAYMVDPPGIATAQVEIGSNLLHVSMSKADTDAETAFPLSAFVYVGANSIVAIDEIISNRVVVLEMESAFTTEMLLSDYIYFNGTGTTAAIAYVGARSWRAVNLTTFNGARPAVQSVIVATDSNGTTPDRVSFVFDMPIDPSTVSAESLVLSPEANPLLEGFEITNQTIADDNKTVTFEIKTSCVAGENCFDTSSTFAKAQLRGVNDPFGNRMLSFSSSQLFETVPPRIAEVIVLGERTLLFRMTEPIQGYSFSTVDPPSIGCYNGSSTTVTCIFDEELETGTNIYLRSTNTRIFGKDGNPVLTGPEHGVALKTAYASSSCTNPFTDIPWWQAGIVMSFAFLGVIGILTEVYLYNVKKGPKVTPYRPLATTNP